MLIFDGSDGLVVSGPIVLWAVLSVGIKSANFIGEQFMVARFVLYPKIHTQIFYVALGFAVAKLRKMIDSEADVRFAKVQLELRHYDESIPFRLANFK